jgi:hypothetical protein
VLTLHADVFLPASADISTSQVYERFGWRLKIINLACCLSNVHINAQLPTSAHSTMLRFLHLQVYERFGWRFNIINLACCLSKLADLLQPLGHMHTLF